MWRTSARSIALLSRSSRIDRKDPASWPFASSEAVEVAASPTDSGFRPTRASNTLDKRANSHDGRLESKGHTGNLQNLLVASVGANAGSRAMCDSCELRTTMLGSGSRPVVTVYL